MPARKRWSGAWACASGAVAVIAVTSCGGGTATPGEPTSAPDGPRITEVKPPRGTWPRGLAFDDQVTLWITEPEADLLRRFEPPS